MSRLGMDSGKAHLVADRKNFMIRFVALAAVAIAAAVNCQSSLAQSPGRGFGILTPRVFGERYANYYAERTPWHGEYYYLKTGQPTALVVPPNVVMQGNYSWGVSQNTMTPVYHQFQGLPPNGASGGIFRATPVYPSHTNQFGIYPVRAPW